MYFCSSVCSTSFLIVAADVLEDKNKMWLLCNFAYLPGLVDIMNCG